MDFSTFDPSAIADEGAVMEVRHPFTDEVFMNGDKPVTITVRGSQSDTVRSIYKKHQNAAQNGRKVNVEKAGMEILVAATIGWSGVAWEGEPLPFNEKNAAKLYGERDFIAQQVLAFMNDADNFFTPEPTT